MSIDIAAHAGGHEAGRLLAPAVRALSGHAPFAVPENRPGRPEIQLTSGTPAPEALPLAELAEAFARITTDTTRGIAALQYSASAGLPRLRELLAERERVAMDRVIITNGALHGVQLALHAVLAPGDVVVVDDPVFPDTQRIIESAGAHALPVTVDEQGLDVDRLETLLAQGLSLKAVYTVPDFHNPSGYTLSARRRRRLLELAERHTFLVVSDNPYRQQRFAGTEVPDFDDDGDHLVRVSTFSKTLGPGLRLGWLVAPRWLAPHLVNLRRRVDFHSNTLVQQVAIDLLEHPGWFDGLIAAGSEIYRGRATLLQRSLQQATADLLAFAEPEGGFFVWARVIDERIETGRLTTAAARAGLHFAPGSAFAPAADSRAHAFVRLAYSTADPADLARAGQLLAEVAEGLR